MHLISLFTYMDNPQNKFLIFPSSVLSTDGFLGLHALTRGLVKKDGQVDIITGQDSLTKYTAVLPFPKNVQIITELPEQKVLLQFPGQDSNVKSIQWNQDKNQLNLYVAVENGLFKADQMKLIKLAAQYKKVITIALGSLEELGNLYEDKFKYIFNESKLVSIGADLKGDVKDVEKHADKSHTTLGEDIYEYIQAESLEIDKDSADELLAAIFYATDGFKADIKSAKAFEICASLFSKGATNSKAQALLEKFAAK